MGSLLRAMLRGRIFRLASARSLAFVAAAFLLIPHFACHCADGRIKPFCIPGRCDRVCGSSSGEKASCCSERSCCARQARNDGDSKQGDPSEPTASTVPCCALVVDALTSVTAPVTVDFSPIPAVAWVADRPVELASLIANRWRHAPVDSFHPPDDIVIRQLRITI